MNLTFTIVFVVINFLPCFVIGFIFSLLLYISLFCYIVVIFHYCLFNLFTITNVYFYNF